MEDAEEKVAEEKVKVQLFLQVYLGYDAPEAPEGYRREKNGILWEYFGTDEWDIAKGKAQKLSQAPGVYNVEIYNVKMWQ